MSADLATLRTELNEVRQGLGLEILTDSDIVKVEESGEDAPKPTKSNGKTQHATDTKLRGIINKLPKSGNANAEEEKLRGHVIFTQQSNFKRPADD